MTISVPQPRETLRGLKSPSADQVRPSLVAAGQAAAVTFAEFYASQWSDVAGFSAALTGSAQVGDELAQEAFARLYARYPLIREPRPYVFRIAANLARRHHSRTQEAPLEWAPEQMTEATGVDQELLDAVGRLPIRLRAVVLLHYYADLPVEEVGHVLRRPTGTVKRQLNEARQALAAALGEQS